jgi:hypothetical protein
MPESGWSSFLSVCIGPSLLTLFFSSSADNADVHTVGLEGKDIKIPEMICFTPERRMAARTSRFESGWNPARSHCGLALAEWCSSDGGQQRGNDRGLGHEILPRPADEIVEQVHDPIGGLIDGIGFRGFHHARRLRLRDLGPGHGDEAESGHG